MTRSNPARKAERAAIDIVDRWVAGRGTVGPPEEGEEGFRIRYLDGRWADGEVKTDFDESRQACRWRWRESGGPRDGCPGNALGHRALERSAEGCSAGGMPAAAGHTKARGASLSNSRERLCRPKEHQVGGAMWDRVSEPDRRLKPEISVTGLCLYFDTNVIRDQSEAVRLLWRCRQEGWVRIQRTDVMDTELETARSDKRNWLLEESGLLAESLGALVLDNSRVDSAVIGTDRDRADFRDAFSILHPNLAVADACDNDIRDAMHVCGAARYGADFFVTRDKGILRKSGQLLERFAASAGDPETVLVAVGKTISDFLKARAITGRPAWVPVWKPPCE
jgi:hypothetical protein